MYDLKQTIEFPGKRRLRLAVAEKNVEVQRLALSGFRSQLTIQVRRAFYTLLVSKQILELKEQRVTLANTFVDAARKKAAAGFAPDFETTKAVVEVVAAQKARHETQAQVMTARAALNTLLGRRPDGDLEIEVAVPSEIPVPVEARLLQQVFAQNPSLKVQELEVERAGLSVQSVRKSRLPDFSVGPSIEYLKDEQTYDFGISVPLPLWDRKRGEIATANAEQQKAVAELDKLRQEISRDVITACHNLSSAKESLALYAPELLGKLKTTLDDAAQSYSEGRTSLLTYLEIQRTYFDTQADYLETLQKLYETRSDLEAAVGVPLSELQNTTDSQEKRPQ